VQERGPGTARGQPGPPSRLSFALNGVDRLKDAALLNKQKNLSDAAPANRVGSIAGFAGIGDNLLRAGSSTQQRRSDLPKD